MKRTPHETVGLFQRPMADAWRAGIPEDQLLSAVIANYRAVWQGETVAEFPGWTTDWLSLWREHTPNPAILGAEYERALGGKWATVGGVLVWQGSNESRRSRGSYFTPPDLVERLLQGALIPALTTRTVAAASLTRDCLGGFPPPSAWSAGAFDAAWHALLGVTVCDPACGVGTFLLAAANCLLERLEFLRSFNPDRLPSSDQLRAHIALHCLRGYDADPLAIELTQLAIAHWADIPVDDPQLQSHFIVCDALFHEPEERFTVVLGNPPFLNAIVSALTEERKRLLVQRYPALAGTADLAFYFLAWAHEYTDSDGAVGLVMPRTVLSAPAASRLRAELLAHRPPVLLYAPDQAGYFDQANVYISLLVLQTGQNGCFVSRDRDEPRFDSIAITGDNWWTPLIQTVPALRHFGPRLADRYEVFASMTTGMAYDVLAFIFDEEREGSLKFITTGLIDPHCCHWGKRPCRYLQKQFQTPYIHEREGLPKTVVERLNRIRRPKILVAGLALRVEAFFDKEGHYAGAVSTFTIVHPKDDIPRLAELADYLNTQQVADIMMAELGATAMGNGRITLSKSFLANLRLPYENSDAIPTAAPYTQ